MMVQLEQISCYWLLDAAEKHTTNFDFRLLKFKEKAKLIILQKSF